MFTSARGVARTITRRLSHQPGPVNRCGMQKQRYLLRLHNCRNPYVSEPSAAHGETEICAGIIRFIYSCELCFYLDVVTVVSQTKHWYTLYCEQPGKMKLEIYQKNVKIVSGEKN